VRAAWNKIQGIAWCKQASIIAFFKRRATRVTPEVARPRHSAMGFVFSLVLSTLIYKSQAHDQRQTSQLQSQIFYMKNIPSSTGKAYYKHVLVKHQDQTQTGGGLRDVFFQTPLTKARASKTSRRVFQQDPTRKKNHRNTHP